MTGELQIDELPSRRTVLLSFYGLASLYAIPYGALNTLVGSYFVFGDRPGASEESIHQSETLVSQQGSTIAIVWLVCLFFVPYLIDVLRGPRNSFVALMFAWGVASTLLVGAYMSSLSGPSGLVTGFATGFAILAGIFGPLGFTGAEVYIDYCAEWLAHIDMNSKRDENGINMVEPLLSESQRTSSMHTQHKALASMFKNRFAAHLYGLMEIGTLVFSLPTTIMGDAAAKDLLIAITVCLLVGAVLSLALSNLQAPPKMTEEPETYGDADQVPSANPENKCSKLREAFVSAWKSLIDCFRCLSAFHYMAALAIVPYFFSVAFASNYRSYILLAPQCALDADMGIGQSKVSLIWVICTISQGVVAFVSPLLIGERKFQVREHVYIMAIGNVCGCLGVVLMMVFGGNSGTCGSFGLLTVVNVLISATYAVSNSVGISAILSWYEGKYQKWVITALASRSVWMQLGGFISPLVYTPEFGKLSNGIPCAATTIAVFAIGSVGVVSAHWINKAWAKMDAKDGRMTTGFEADIAMRETYRTEDL